MAEKQIKDLTLLEAKSLILDHLDNINVSQQTINVLRQHVANLANSNGDAGNSADEVEALLSEEPNK